MLTGAFGPSWARRARTIKAFNQVLWRPSALPPALPSFEPEPPISRPLLRHRPQLLAVAKALVDAWLQRSVEGMAPWLAHSVWQLWPDGSLLRHDREALLEALGQADGDRLSGFLDAPRAYSPAEADAALARGVFDAHAFLGGYDAPWVTMSVRAARTGRARLLLVADPASVSAGQPKFLTLPMPAADEAALASAPGPGPEAHAARAADRAVRAVLLGKGPRLRSLAPNLTPQLEIDGELASPGAWAARLDEPEHRLDAAELTFESAVTHSRAELEASAYPDRLEIGGSARWGPRFSTPELVSVPYGFWDADEARILGRQRAVALVVRAERPDGTGAFARRFQVGLIETRARD